MTAPVGSADPLGLDQGATYSEIIQAYLSQWGLSSLAPLVQQLGQTGASNDQIALTIQNSDAYKQRFAGNAQRVANGLAALDPATYIAMEGQYRQILSQLPGGFYQSQADYANFIGNDVSASELSDRVSLANTAYMSASPEARNAWDQYYGTAGAGGAVAAILDTGTAEPLIQQQVTAAGIGGAALQQGLSLTRQNTAMQAAQQGVTIDQARQAYSQIAQRLTADTAISGRYASPVVGQFGQQQEEQATLLNNASAQQKQSLLYSEESGQFSGHGGANANGSSNNPGANY